MIGCWKKARLWCCPASPLAATYLQYASLGLRRAALHLDLFEPPSSGRGGVAKRQADHGQPQMSQISQIPQIPGWVRPKRFCEICAICGSDKGRLGVGEHLKERRARVSGKVISARAAIDLITSGDTLAIHGAGGGNVEPDLLIKTLAEKFAETGSRET